MTKSPLFSQSAGGTPPQSPQCYKPGTHSARRALYDDAGLVLYSVPNDCGSEEAGPRPTSPSLPPPLMGPVMCPMRWWGEGWWGKAWEENSVSIHQSKAHTARRNNRRKKDKARRSDPHLCKAKHARKVQKALQQQAPCYTSQEIIELCRNGLLTHKRVNEFVHDYVVYTLPKRGIITCPKSGLRKLSCGVCVRRDLISSPEELRLPSSCPKLEGPVIISTREYKNVSRRLPPCIDEEVLKHISSAEFVGANKTNSALAPNVDDDDE